MFLEKILDGSNILGPLTNRGWNLYSDMLKSQVDEVGPNGFRSELDSKFDRDHPASLLQVPLQNVVFYMMHGETRVLEKILNVENERIQSQANISGNNC